jgi:hypothetical protein
MAKEVLVLDVSGSAIEAVMGEFEREHPGKSALRDMRPEEFADKMMAKILATARMTPRSEALEK